MNKRIIAALLAASIMFSFAACNTSSQKDDRIDLTTRVTETNPTASIDEPQQSIADPLGTTTAAGGETTEESDTSEPADSTASTETSGTTAKPATKALGKVTVSDAFKKTYAKNQFGIKASVRIPKITIAGVDTKKLNKEIYDYCKKKAGSYCSCSYSYYIGKTYVSLFITLQEEHDSSPAAYYRVYNISRSNGKKLSKKQMLKILKISDKKFKSRVKKAITKYFKKAFSYSKGSWVNTELKKAVSAKQLKKAIPYVNSKGKLSFMIKDLPIPAGKGMYDHYGTC